MSLLVFLFLLVAACAFAEADSSLGEPFYNETGVGSEPPYLLNGAEPSFTIDVEHLAREGGREAESVEVLVVGWRGSCECRRDDQQRALKQVSEDHTPNRLPSSVSNAHSTKA